MSDTPPPAQSAEHARLAQDAARKANWKRWGTYLADRQWGTVREDYSPDGDCWSYFPHDHARSRAYRWGEDGLLGWCDRQGRLCLALSLWNGNDPILKERLFGLTGPEGNHGEDVKELYWHLDATPTHSYALARYRYPVAAYPYDQLVAANAARGKDQPEVELTDTDAFRDGWFDITVAYAKGAADDTFLRITATLCDTAPGPKRLDVLPTVWFRNTWRWGCTYDDCEVKPRLHRAGANRVELEHASLGRYHFTVEGEPELLFTDNETNHERLFKTPNPARYVKDAFDRRVIHGQRDAVNPAQHGTKAAAWYRMTLRPGETVTRTVRLCPVDEPARHADAVFHDRKQEADAFYDTLHRGLPPHEAALARHAMAGLQWSKQFYHYVVKTWLDGDPNVATPPPSRKAGRNHDWPHLFSRDVLSMPDKWEYPWFAAWDSAFHMVAMARSDPHFVKSQLELFLREWYMHPNGQVPAYEFAFGDVNPPVHAWAVWRVYKLTGPRGQRDRRFLATCFQKLLINFTWWVNRKDPQGDHLFSGGFLGLDNIGVFDRSRPLPSGHTLTQADGTAWMAFYCGTMLHMAIELAQEDPAYEDMASKFFEHFVHIADAINNLGGSGLWDEKDGFYYDQLRVNGQSQPIRLRSLVGLLPLIAAEVFEGKHILPLIGFRKRTKWFLDFRQDLVDRVTFFAEDPVHGKLVMLAIPTRERLERVLRVLLDENEFLAPFGLRSMSRVYEQHPYRMSMEGTNLEVRYQPGESDTRMFGGNSNWRGPVWMPTNYLLIEALRRYHYFFGDTLQMEYPTGSGQRMTLDRIADLISQRIRGLFVPDPHGVPPSHAHLPPEHARAGPLFFEYFHPESGRGCGASHQTGWTALIAKLLLDSTRPIS